MKWRYFRHLLGGGDPDAERIYLWHIATRRATNRMAGIGMDGAKPNDGAYVPAAKALLASMQANGFDPNEPIPIDASGELLGGAHRVACALALAVAVRVQEHDTTAWAPEWGVTWFAQSGMSIADLARLQQDFDTINGMKRAA